MNISRCLITLLFCVASLQTTFAQPYHSKPKLVVGIVIDQMRQDYINRFWELYGEDGFKKLVQQGYSFPNAHFNYFPTFTGAGHANISTGASPSINGIVANDWYEGPDRKKVYCSDDPKVQGVGTDGPAGKMSPANLLTTTIGDELKLASNGRSKVFGVSIKDRGAILSAGHAADAAYWFDGNSGDFISSTFYMTSLPKWVTSFNKRKLWDKYLDYIWRPIVDMNKLKEMVGPDDNNFENTPKGMDKPIFPYDLKKIRKQYSPELLASTPWGNTITFDFAKLLLREERLGKGDQTDMLFVSLSSTDYIGHFNGTRSMEIADLYVRLDKELGEFIQTLEQEVGKGNVLIFLSADHGVADNPAFSQSKKIPAGQFNMNAINIGLRNHLDSIYGADILETYRNYQLYFNKKVMKEKNIDLHLVEQSTVAFLEKQDGVLRAFPATQLRNFDLTEDLMKKYQRGFLPDRCGDIYMVMKPGWLEMYWQEKGTTHGSPYVYDTHVPIMFYGKGVPAGHSFDNVSVSQIAPTLAALLGVSPPNGSFDAPLIKYFTK